ncbi:MAG: 3'-5' exonuclease [Clostridia bacterium]|nr:3'-5' exonuclease [Clostridia bacterium]
MDTFAKAYQVLLDDETYGMMRKRFIAFDTEITGLQPTTDRIVELGAVEFINGQPGRSFSSLVNPGMFIRPSSENVNHISNEMLKTAPREPEAYRAFLDFLGDAYQGETLLCAHNAKVDFTFFVQALNRCRYNAQFYYIDTLSLSREYLPGMPDYKQVTLAEELDIVNEDAHRASSDAEVCGKIMWHILDAYHEKQE